MSTYRIVGLWEDPHYNKIYKILDSHGDPKHVWSARQHMREDGRDRRSILVYCDKLAEKIAKVGDARIHYDIKVGPMTLEDHMAIGAMLFRRNIPTYVSTQYGTDGNIVEANWGIADKSLAALVKLQWGKSKSK